MTTGPLKGVRVVEFQGIGPGPFCGMMLSDMGADVLSITRPGQTDHGTLDGRGKKLIEVDLKKPEGVALCLRLLEKADVTFEGNRPGVMERLGLGPEQVLARNPAIVYGRITGWGQTGPYAMMAGHDLNYAALSGPVHAIGSAERPYVPLNLIADYGGGAMFLFAGLLAALHHAKATGEGQVIDAAMSDGSAYLSTLFYGFLSAGMWSDNRQANLLDGGRPYYDCYQCADGKWISLGSVEPQFFAAMVKALDLGEGFLGQQEDPEAWPRQRARIAEVVRGKTQEEWCAILDQTDVCFAPVLSFGDAPNHAHHRARETFVTIGGVVQPAPAPRFSATPAAIQHPRIPRGEGVREMLASWQVDDATLQQVGC